MRAILVLPFLFCACQNAATTTPTATSTSTSTSTPTSTDIATTTSHPGKRPWSQDEITARLDAMSALEKDGLEAMGRYAHDQAYTPIDFSDPRSAYGGGPGPDLAAFNDGAMKLLENAAAKRAGATKDRTAMLALCKEIASIPLPAFSNSGGATSGDPERRRIIAAATKANGADADLQRECAAVPLKNNRDFPPPATK